MRVLGADGRRVGLCAVDHVEVGSVDVEIETGDDEVLVVRRVRLTVDDGAVGRGFSLGQGGRDYDAGRPYLALDVAVLIEAPVDEILVVGDGHVERNHHTPHATHLGYLLSTCFQRTALSSS